MAETGIPQRLICPNGDILVFNDYAAEATDGLLMIFDVQGLDSPVLRVTTDDRGQRPGVILHPSQHGARLPVISGRILPTSLAQGVAWQDRIRAAADSLLQADGRYCWTPTGQTERFLAVRMNAELGMDHDNPFRNQSDGQALIKQFSFPLIAADPVAKTLAETDASRTGAGSVSISNNGNVDAYPVIQVHGAYTDFVLTNDTTGRSITWAGTSIGNTHYIEIVMRDETMFKDGDGADQLYGLDVTTSDFFWLQPGVNSITLSGLAGNDASTAILIKSNDAWG
jgi:hypothetical protein